MPARAHKEAEGKGMNAKNKARWNAWLASAGIRHDSPFGLLLWRVYASPKLRWNSYIRACRKIPKDSPVCGSISWKRINERRCELINAAFGSGKKDALVALDRNPEYRALQDVPCGDASLIVSNFVMGRLLRRMEAKTK